MEAAGQQSRRRWWASANSEGGCFRIASILVLLVFGICAFVQARYSFVGPIGESHNYKLPTISLVNHFSDEVTKEDIAIARQVFPEENWRWDLWEQDKAGNPKVGNTSYTFYFPLYSAAVIPFIALARLLGIPPAYGFPVANSFYLAASLALLIMLLRASEKIKFAIVLTVCLSPVIMYITWASAEVFICSLVIAALVFLFNKSYRLAIFFISLAATLNVALIMLSALVYVAFIEDQRRCRGSFAGALSASFEQIRTVAVLVAINCIALVPLAINYRRFGTLVTMQSSGTLVGLAGRFVAYWTDLNFGFLPYFPLALLLIVLALSISGKRIEYIAALGAVVLMAAVFSILVHINSGMTGIQRYLTWTSTVIMVTTLYYGGACSSGRRQNIFFSLAVVSALVSGAVTFYYGGFLAVYNPRADYTKMTPVARFVLDRWPAAYNPLYSSFNNRLSGIDGGYALPDYPIAYVGANGSVKKAMLTPAMERRFAARLCGNVRGDLFSSRDKKMGYHYVNFNSDDVFLCERPGAEFRFNTTEHAMYLTSGWSRPEGWGTWSAAKAATIQFVLSRDVKEIVLRVHPFVTSSHPEQKIIISAANAPLIEQTLTLNDRAGVEIVIPASKLFDGADKKDSSKVSLEIQMPNAVSPKDLGLSSDTRLLALGLTSLSIR